MGLIPTCDCGLPEGVKKLPHKPGCFLYSSPTLNKELTDLLAKIDQARGDAPTWAKRQTLVMNFTAGLPDTMRMFCRGEVRIPNGFHYPAILVYQTGEDETMAWAPSGNDDKMERHHSRYFHSTIPHVGIAREVLDTENSTL